MTYLTAALPIVQLLTAALICCRWSWRHHPALMSYLACETAWQVLGIAGVPISSWSRLMQFGVRAGIVYEVAVFARIPISREMAARVVALLLAGSAWLSSRPTALQSAFLQRQWEYLPLAGIALTIAAYRAIWPVLECRRHRAYRNLTAVWLGVIAVSGSFVPGGLGYRVLPYTAQTWHAVNQATYAALVVITAAMGLTMALPWPKRKAAAKAADVWQRRKVAA